MADRWFISDHHFWHENIIKFCDRPFSDALEMNEKLIEWHNAYVKPADHVSFLGDVTLRRGGKAQQDEFIALIKRMSGHKRLYLGNHDHFPVEVYLKAGFEEIYATWRTQEDILFSHIPIHPSSLSTAIANVHGHIHNQKDYKPYVVFTKDQVFVKPYINISCEMTDYRPLNLDEILARIKQAIVGAGTLVKDESQA